MNNEIQLKMVGQIKGWVMDMEERRTTEKAEIRGLPEEGKEEKIWGKG